MSISYLLANFGFDTAENEPYTVCNEPSSGGRDESEVVMDLDEPETSKSITRKSSNGSIWSSRTATTNAGWAANKRLEISNFNFKFPRA